MGRKRGRGGAGAPSSRPDKVGEVIRQELSSMIGDGTIKDPRLEAAMATITGVDMSPDLQHGKVYVSVFDEDEAVPCQNAATVRRTTPQRAVGGHRRCASMAPRWVGMCSRLR